jgi:hypothetical protein
MSGRDEASTPAAVTALAPAAWWRGIGGLTRSGSPVEAVAWALYDFANTIFSFAVVSGAIGLWLTDPSRFGERDGNFLPPTEIEDLI